ncbi:MAG: hypothetical protein QNK37_18345 [Acidobacteriota bacterium]|nr:hypothetical protein [Acidobacteriota bacterium]
MIKKAVFALGLCFSLVLGASQYLAAGQPTWCYESCWQDFNACLSACERLPGFGEQLLCESVCMQQKVSCDRECLL